MSDRAALQPSPIGPEQVAALIRGRRTVDHFLPEVPDIARIREAIEVARWAPNHHLTQPWRFHLIGPRTRDAIIELNTALVAQSKGEEVAEAKRTRWAGIPGWLAVTCVRAEDPVTASEDYAACACAIQNLTLYLHSAGIACKWASGAVTRDPDFLRLLGVDAARAYCVGLIWYGYAKRKPRSQRAPVETIIDTHP